MAKNQTLTIVAVIVVAALVCTTGYYFLTKDSSDVQADITGEWYLSGEREYIDYAGEYHSATGDLDFLIIEKQNDNIFSGQYYDSYFSQWIGICGIVCGNTGEAYTVASDGMNVNINFDLNDDFDAMVVVIDNINKDQSEITVGCALKTGGSGEPVAIADVAFAGGWECLFYEVIHSDGMYETGKSSDTLFTTQYQGDSNVFCGEMYSEPVKGAVIEKSEGNYAGLIIGDSFAVSFTVNSDIMTVTEAAYSDIDPSQASIKTSAFVSGDTGVVSVISAADITGTWTSTDFYSLSCDGDSYGGDMEITITERTGNFFYGTVGYKEGSIDTLSNMAGVLYVSDGIVHMEMFAVNGNESSIYYADVEDDDMTLAGIFYSGEYYADCASLER